MESEDLDLIEALEALQHGFVDAGGRVAAPEVQLAQMRCHRWDAGDVGQESRGCVVAGSLDEYSFEYGCCDKLQKPTCLPVQIKGSECGKDNGDVRRRDFIRLQVADGQPEIL